MDVTRLCVIACLCALPAAIAAQSPHTKDAKHTITTADVNQPHTISGLASSGRNCVGPSGANVHPIGWVPSNSRVTVTFSSDFDPVASATIMQLGGEAPDRVARSAYWADDDGGGNLDPRLNFTTTYSGTITLHVSKYSAERSAGCYFYKVEIVTG